MVCSTCVYTAACRRIVSYQIVYIQGVRLPASGMLGSRLGLGGNLRMMWMEGHETSCIVVAIRTTDLLLLSHSHWY